jgi:hypothetical protein
MLNLNILFYVHELDQIVKDAGPRDIFYGKNKEVSETKGHIYYFVC